MTIQEINPNITEGRLLLFAIRLMAIEKDLSMEESLRLIEQFTSMANNKPDQAHKPHDFTADLLEQIRHLESENNLLKDALNAK